MNRRRFALSMAGLSPFALLAGQDPEKPADAPEPDRPEATARAEDVATIDAIVAALYDVISGPRGAARDLDRLRSLFAPGARLVPVVARRDEGPALRVLDIEGFLEIAGPAFERDGFFESEVARETEQFGHIAHVFSTYEARRAKDEEPFIRGINSIQLFHDGARWWVLTIFWDTEREGTPIPPAYLPAP